MAPTAVPPTAVPSEAARGPREWWGRLPRRQRRTLRALFALGAVLVLVLSGLLARFLTVENLERDSLEKLVQAEARGDVAGMFDQLDGCRSNATCVAGVKADASDPKLRRTGSVKILQLESPTAYSLFGASGRTRVAWTVIGTLPVVQCVAVKRSGNFLSGIHLHLTAIGPPISGEGRCTKATQLEKEEEEATALER